MAATLDAPASDNPFADLMPSVGAPDSSTKDYGPFADLVAAGDPAPQTAKAASESIPSPNELIGGGTADAPAFQIVGQNFSDVPRGVAVSTTDYGPFSDLVAPQVMPAINDYEKQFGVFADLVPKVAPETEKAVMEVPGERPPLAMKIAGWIDEFANKVTGGRSGATTLQDLVSTGTREPLPGEPSFTNAGIPTIPQQKEGTIAEAAAGVANVPIGFANFLLSSGGLATVKSLGMAPKLIRTLVGAGFTAEQAHEFVNAKTMQEKVTSGIGTLLLGAGTAADALTGKPTPETPVRPASAPEAAPVSLEQRLPLPSQEVPAASEAAPNLETVRSEAKFSPSSKSTEFVPSIEWQEVPQGTVLPNGGEYRMDQASGKNYARWSPENLPEVSTTAAESAATSQPGKEEVKTQSTAAPADVGAAVPTNDWTSATLPELKTEPAPEEPASPEPLGAVAPGTAELQAAGEAVAGAAGRVKGAVTNLKEFHDFRRARLNWSARNQASTGEIHKAATDILKSVPSVERRQGITNWIQAKGDVAELAARAAATKNLQLRKGYEAAQSLTPDEQALAGKISQTYEILRQRAEDNGIEINRIEDYVNQIWKRAPLKDFAASSSRRLSSTVRFAKQRFHDSFFHGEQAGLKPETKDIAKLLPIYMNEVNNAISAKQFVAEMAKGKAGDERPLLAPRGGGTVIDATEGKKGAILTFPDRMTEETTDYRVLDQPALHQWKWVGEENGKPILLKGDLAVHPEAYGHLKNVLGQSAIREWFYSPSESALGAIPKVAAKFLVDDVQQIGKATMLGFLSPFHQVQEGTHAIGHRVNPFGGLEKIDLTQPKQLDAARHGLMLLPDRVSAQQFKEGLDGSTRNLFANVIGKAGKPGAKVKEWSDGYQHYLFHQYIPALKLKTYEHILGRNQERFAKELKGGTATLDQVKLLSAEQSNAAYGHLNYADMGRNPTLQHIAQTFLLAPDFLEARTRFAGQALGGILSKTGREQMAAIATLAATQWILSRVLNKTLDDDYHFDEPFGVIVGNRRYTMRSVPEDIYKAFTDTRRFAYGRLSPLIGRGLIEGYSGVNYRSEPTGFADTLTNILGGMIPLTVQPLTRGLTETGRDNPVSPLEQLLGSLGLHVSRFSPISKVYSLSKAWVDEHGKDFGITPQKGTFPISKYQQLRYALEDGDFERAKAEEQKLIEAGERPDKIRKGFRQSINHPFTGSEANDRRFKKSLSPEDRQLYDAAVKRRRLILQRFGMIPK